MGQLSPEGQQVVNDLAQRHGFSNDAVTHMMFAVLNGNGSMAQFNHPEFAGSGQWMKGGMIMLGDMFNNYLKGRVDSLCWDICNILEQQPGLLRTGSFQSQSQGGGSQQSQGYGSPMGASSLFVPDPNDNWWPQDLGSPNATGAQNNVRYAYFSGSRRLAVKTGGDVWVYDTLDHQIGGFSQQQGSGGSILFTSQYGMVNLSTLPIVSRNGQLVSQPQPNYSNGSNGGFVSNQNSSWNNSSNFSQPAPQPAPMNNPAPATSSLAGSADILTALERLGDLKAKGFITDDEFNAKKGDLLSRL